MPEAPRTNPLLGPLLESFEIKRSEKTGLIPRNWLLITLRIVDLLRDRDAALLEDDIYSYDFTLKQTRAAAIPMLLGRYNLPTKLGLSNEGVTVRGAPGYRLFRAIQGGGVLLAYPPAEREAFILEAVEAIREEMMKIVGQKLVELPSNVFEHSGRFLPALLAAVKNRSNGRVEQALVGAKLQLRFPDTNVPVNTGYAPDRQTGRESDYEVGNLRVLVSVSPNQGHFQSAKLLADEGREVYLVVSEQSFASARKRIQKEGYEGTITVDSVISYVTSNMKETSHQLRINAREMCSRLVAEYNRRIAADRDHSLQVVLPSQAAPP